MLKTIYYAALALAMTASAASAQMNQKPWQGTFTKTSHNLTGGRMFLDLPVPSDDRILTIEQISLVVGPWLSIYGKVLDCQLESHGPIVENLEGAAQTTSVPLPDPVTLQPGIKMKGIPAMPVKIHATGGAVALTRTKLRLSCAVEYLGGNEPFVVTAVGYTTPK